MQCPPPEKRCQREHSPCCWNVGVATQITNSTKLADGHRILWRRISLQTFQSRPKFITTPGEGCENGRVSLEEKSKNVTWGWCQVAELVSVVRALGAPGTGDLNARAPWTCSGATNLRHTHTLSARKELWKRESPPPRDDTAFCWRTRSPAEGFRVQAPGRERPTLGDSEN